MEYVYEMRVLDSQLPAKTLMEVKKLTGLPLSEIKARVSDGRSLFQCECADEDGMVLLLNLHSVLSASGAIAEFIDCGDPAPIQYLRNALQAYREIDEEDYPD